MRRYNKAYLDLAILICVYLICNGMPFSRFINNSYICDILNILLLCCFIYFAIRYSKKNEMPKIKCEKINKRSILFIPFALLPFSNFIFALINNSNYLGNFDVFDLILNLLKCALVAFCEECLFRGILTSLLKQDYNNFKTIIYSSIVFGLAHLLNISSLSSILPSLLQVGYSFVLGLIVAFTYIYSNNIFVPITIHFMFNFFNSYLVTSMYELEWNVLFFVVNILIGAILLLYEYMLFKKLEKEDLPYYDA